MRPEQVKIALTLADGTLAIMSFVTRGLLSEPTDSFDEAVAVAQQPRQPGMRVTIDAEQRPLRVIFEREPTDENIQAEIDRTALPSACVSWRRIADADVPMSREYRDAWKDDGSTIVHDMPKARELHRERLRAARKPLLEALDVEAVRADEDGDVRKKADVVARKRALRDVTTDPRIDAAKTVDELRAVGLPS